MLFNSAAFLFLFAPLVYGIYWRMQGQESRKLLSLLASYVFYGVWSAKFALLMLATTSVDFFTARWIEDAANPRARKALLAVSMTVNLGVLALFKYWDFFASSINALAPRPFVALLKVALPIGISFYTFESMSYTIDVYKGHTKALRRFVDYGHFVTMFPRLVAGPIVRYTDVAQQLRVLPKTLSATIKLEAAHFFTLGLVKKVLIADVIAARLVDPLFPLATQLSMVQGWLAALGYTAQLYFDFSGYSDMAVALGLLLGFRFTRNFNLPYASQNIGEFWRRWHISLSTWLRDYLYIPLGGNRGNRDRNLFLTMLLGGLWHGANWTFVLWGAYHGAALIVHNKTSTAGLKMPEWTARALTFVAAVVGWVIFRAESVTQAKHVYLAMLGTHGLGLRSLLAYKVAIVWLIGALAISMTRDTYDVPVPKTRFAGAVEGALLALCVLRLAVPSPFLYFQF
jgi:alginate O-acetyltransferase complex protein AlgI